MKFEEGGYHANEEDETPEDIMQSRYQEFVQQVNERFRKDIIEDEEQTLEEFKQMIDMKVYTHVHVVCIYMYSDSVKSKIFAQRAKTVLPGFKFPSFQF